MKKQEQKGGGVHCKSSCKFYRYLIFSPLQIQMDVVHQCSRYHTLPSSLTSLAPHSKNVGKHFKMLLEILKQEDKTKLDSSVRRMGYPNQLFHETIQFPNLSLKRTDLLVVPSNLLVQFLWTSPSTFCVPIFKSFDKDIPIQLISRETENLTNKIQIKSLLCKI